jgi:hypothetical protein
MWSLPNPDGSGEKKERFFLNKGENENDGGFFFFFFFSPPKLPGELIS